MEEQLKKLQTCVYIIIVLLLVNTIALFASLKDPSEEANTDTTETTYEYDVSMFTEVDADGYMEALNKDELSVVYLGRETCGYCVQFLPVLQQAQTAYGYKTLYINTDNISNEDLTRVLETMGLELSTFGTPTTAVIKNGEVLDKHVGYTDYLTFSEMLEKNGFGE